MIDVMKTTEADPDEIWAVVSDLDHWADTLPTMRQVTRLGADGPIGTGDRFEVLATGLPRAVYEITEWRPGHAFTWVASAPGVRTTATHALEPYAGGTVVALGIRWSGPLAWLTRLLLGRKTRRMVAQEADAFVRLAEHAR
jgi:hypothetical protein